MADFKTVALKCEPKFEIKKIVATPACMREVDPDYAITCLANHMCGDWGMVEGEDKVLNDRAVERGQRILSVWPLPGAAGEFWILTEADRSVTTFLLPKEY
jgi:hypothetical protein